MTSDALRRQNQTRSQSADPRQSPPDHLTFKRNDESKLTERPNHEQQVHRRFSELTSNHRSMRVSELTSNRRSVRFSEMIPNRRSIKFDEQFDADFRSGSQDSRKLLDRDRRGVSKLIKGRISFLNPSTPPVDFESSGEILTAVQCINNSPKSRHSEIL